MREPHAAAHWILVGATFALLAVIALTLGLLLLQATVTLIVG